MSDATARMLLKQGQLQRSIVRALENLKKVGRPNITPAMLRSRITTVKENWTMFLHGHSELLGLVSEAAQQSTPYFKDNVFDGVEDAYQAALDYMNEFLEQLEPPAVSLSQSISESAADFARSSFALSHLPPISLPPFDGNLDQWEHFRDRFTTLIIQNRDLKDFARMHYLVSCFTGSALECVRDLSVTAENFKNAWQALNLRFENKRRLIRAHLSTLLNLPSVSREFAGDLQILLDKVNSSLTSLKNLNRRSKDLWNDMLVHLVYERLDASSRKAWSLKVSDSDNLPSFDDLRDFLQNRQRALDDLLAPRTRPAHSKTSPHKISASTALSSSASAPVSTASHIAPSANARPSLSHSGSGPCCPICQAKHFFNSCPQFVKGNLSQRRNLVQAHKRCFNCLGGNHSSRECPSKYTCRICHQRHHSLLHDGATAGSNSSPTQDSAISDTAATVKPQAEVTSLVASREPIRGATPVLLATAWISVTGQLGREVRVRALIDQGSEMTFVSESVAHLLRVKRIRCPVAISAVGGTPAGTYQFASRLVISPVDHRSSSLEVLALILPKLTSYAPRHTAGISSLSHLQGLRLADADPSSREPIHIILGADIYNDIILDGLKKGAPGQLIAQNSIFGWVISGPVDSRVTPVSGTSHLACVAAHLATGCDGDFLDLSAALERFWVCEEPPDHHKLSLEDEKCESHFVDTYARRPDGRFIVRLPFKNPPPLEIGHSKTKALNCMHSLLRRFRANPDQASEYRAFMTEYLSLGHMRLAPPSELRTIFIPHHPVFRPDSLTSRIRVVFNASSRTSNGSSLNDHLHAGPKLQSDLPTVILRWRVFRYVCTADIAKMYRQILVDERDIDFQRILWQPDPSDQIREYQLLTVTYGTACAPFLALRVLKQLALDDGHDFPLAQRILNENIYVDDVLFGADTLNQLIGKRDQLVNLLRRGCFTLRKWASNAPQLLSDIDPDDHGLACSPIPVADEHLKILGVHWIPFSDDFQFRVAISESIPTTKRSILSVIAKFYDPLSWVTPTIICAKIIIQQLWKLSVAWDDPVPPLIMSRWRDIYTSLPRLNSVRVPRWIGIDAASHSIELHGFADASSAAYAAVVYSRVISQSGEVFTSLLIGKSKVAPVNLLSIPRLELSAAVLLAKLVEFVRSLFGQFTVRCTCWTDSSIVLAWLRQPPSRWKTFVANRVADIQTRLSGVDWRHVVTTDNPADCASRGLTGGDLATHPLWWHGLPWLKLPRDHWPESLVGIPVDAPMEQRVMVAHAAATLEPFDLAERFSSWPKLIRVTAYILRFVARCRRQYDNPEPDSVATALTAHDCTSAKLFWLKFVQAAVFPRELHALTSAQPVSTNSPLNSLHVFLDRDGLLRVGGRLRRSPLTFTVRHPIVLAAHSIVTLIIAHAHIRSLHGGLQLTLNTLRREFWILRARTLVKFLVHKCVVCVRERAAAPSQLMGDLPACRVSAPARCFLHCGLDYAGPFLVRSSGGRGVKSTKGYIALFVCMATRAIHLELVSDYSTPTFLNAFSRFCARRGSPTHIYSDNGTTFVGADRDLTSAYRSAIRDPQLQNRVACDNISWHFIPPAAPHFGGLWEAGVKSTKHHLRRVIGAHTLTFEEFSTLLCRIEACLNSRPLAPLTDSCDSYDVLTPGNFLIGSALTAPPEESTLDCPESRLTRWQLVRRMTERLWSLWYNDYVNNLQQRAKWRRAQPALKVGQLVILKNSALPPCKWELGRVTDCFPGSDGLTRVVSVKTASSEFRRPLSKLCVLPIDIDVPSSTR